MTSESLTISRTPDGTFTVSEAEDGAGEVIDQAVKSPEEVMQLVQAFLTDNDMPAPDFDDAQASKEITGPTQTAAPSVATMRQAWAAESANRDPDSGMRR
jgi:hypothetical protein